MTTYRCLACGADLEIERTKELDLVEIKPCESCLEVTQEEAEQRGWEQGAETADEELFNDGRKEGYREGYKEGHYKGTETGRISGFGDSNINEVEKN